MIDPDEYNKNACASAFWTCLIFWGIIAACIATALVVALNS